MDTLQLLIPSRLKPLLQQPQPPVGATSVAMDTLQLHIPSRLMKLLMKLLAIPLGNHKTVAKWLVIAIPLSHQKTMAKWLVMKSLLQGAAVFVGAALAANGWAGADTLDTPRVAARCVDSGDERGAGSGTIMPKAFT